MVNSRSSAVTWRASGGRLRSLARSQQSWPGGPASRGRAPLPAAVGARMRPQAGAAKGRRAVACSTQGHWLQQRDGCVDRPSGCAGSVNSKLPWPPGGPNRTAATPPLLGGQVRTLGLQFHRGFVVCLLFVSYRCRCVRGACGTKQNGFRANGMAASRALFCS